MHIKFYMHHVETYKMCQAFLKNMQNFHASSTRDREVCEQRISFKTTLKSTQKKLLKKLNVPT